MSDFEAPMPAQDSPAVRELRALARGVSDQLSDAGRSGRETPGLVHLVGIAAIVAELSRMEPSARRSVWVMQEQYFYDPEDPGVELTHSTQARGIQTLLITRPASLAMHPLLPSIFPATRLAPVFLGMLIVDEDTAIIAGEASLRGDRTSWLTTRPDLVAAALELWHRTMELSTPVLPPGAQPPLSRRQLRVAQLLAVGEKDQAIARRLDLSPRTVEREVAAILSELGARSRTEAVLLMRGRGVNGGRPHT